MTETYGCWRCTNPATKEYWPPCKCAWACARWYLCDACAATVEPKYLEDLDDDD